MRIIKLGCQEKVSFIERTNLITQSNISVKMQVDLATTQDSLDNARKFMLEILNN